MVTKPTPGATGWNVAVDEVIDIANAVADLPTRVTALEAGGIGDVTEAELAAGLATKAPTSHVHTDLLDQATGDNRYILQTNANAFAPADATTTALAGKQPLDADLTALAGLDSTTAGTVASDGAGWVKKTYAQLRTALGLATIATSGKLADATDLTTTGAAVGQLLAPTAVSGGVVTDWGLVPAQVTVLTGVDTTGTTDVSAALQAKIDAMNTAGGGILYVPKGVYRLNTSILPKSNVSIVGAGRRDTIFQPRGVVSAFRGEFGTVAPLSNVVFADFAVDGSLQVGTFDVSIKGLYLTYLKNCTFRRLHIHDTGASGLGCDFLNDCIIDDVIAEGCGRLGTTTSPGCAGIGIGTNNWGGTLIVQNCITRDNKRCGIFFESQFGSIARDVQLVNHLSEHNQDHGIADAGCDGLQVIGGRSRSNTRSGFAVYGGTIGSGVPGQNGTVTGLDCSSNTEHGYHIDTTAAASAGSYVIQGGRSRNNVRYGIILQVGAAAYAGLTVQDMSVALNGRSGMLVISSGGGAISDVSITNNRFRSNGTDTAQANSLRCGVTINSSVTRLEIIRNKAWDPQTTKTQVYGIVTDGAATLSAGSIDGNDLRGNIDTGYANSATAAAEHFIGLNLGYNVATGSPEGLVKAPVGTEFRRTDGGVGGVWYIKETGTSITGWARATTTAP